MGREWALDCIDERSHRGVEIGPLASPIASKANGPVLYVDHADTATLRRKYADDAHMRTRLDDIVEVDFVVPEGRSLAKALASEGPFDYVIASHVIEHVPDMVTWLDDIHSLLVTGGILSLVVPDKRFTFDVNRQPTDVSAILDGYHRRLSRPSFGHIYDFSSRTIHGVDAGKIWSGQRDYRDAVRTDCTDPDLMAFEFASKVLATDEFIDIHCHVFTPESFLAILAKLGHLGLLKYEVAAFHPTERGGLEFFASLRALDLADRDLRDRQQSAIAAALASLRAADSPATEVLEGDAVGTGADMQLSDLERRLIGFKRAAMRGLRRMASIGSPVRRPPWNAGAC